MKDEARPTDCKEPSNEWPGCHAVEPGCCLVGGGEPLEGLTGGNGAQMSILQITLVSSVEDELEVYSGEKDGLEIVEA